MNTKLNISDTTNKWQAKGTYLVPSDTTNKWAFKNHSHSQTDITNLKDSLQQVRTLTNGKADSSHTHNTIYEDIDIWECIKNSSEVIQLTNLNNTCIMTGPGLAINNNKYELGKQIKIGNSYHSIGTIVKIVRNTNGDTIFLDNYFTATGDIRGQKIYLRQTNMGWMLMNLSTSTIQIKDFNDVSMIVGSGLIGNRKLYKPGLPIKLSNSNKEYNNIISRIGYGTNWDTVFTATKIPAPNDYPVRYQILLKIFDNNLILKLFELERRLDNLQSP